MSSTQHDRAVCQDPVQATHLYGGKSLIPACHYLGAGAKASYTVTNATCAKCLNSWYRTRGRP